MGCNRCQSTGTVRCPQCHGSGEKKTVKVKASFFKREVTEIEKCTNCNSGWVICNSCGGVNSVFDLQRR